MKTKIFALGVPLVAAIATGASALMVAPIACGCESPPKLLAATAGLDFYKPFSYSSAEIASGLERKLPGEKRSPYGLLAKGPSCREISSTRAVCFVAMETSWALSRGFEITLSTDKEGTITKAAVRETWRASR